VGLRSRPVAKHLMYVVVALLIIAGVAYATVSLSGQGQSAGGQYVRYTGSVPGVAALGLAITMIPLSAPAQASTDPTSLTLLVLGGSLQTSAYCANPCTGSDFSQEVEYLITAQVASEGFLLSIGAQAGSNSVATTVYFEIPATSPGFTTTNLEVFVDLSTSSPVTSFTATIQQCPSDSSCT
jgi:hypothetical protein